VTLTLDDVRRAQERIRPHLAVTPLRRSFALRPRPALLKLECWQPTGSFKVRGALNAMACLTPEQQERGVVTASAGNHALGVALASELLGGSVHATVFVPRTAPRAKLEKLRSFRVSVQEAGATYDEAFAAAERHARTTGATFVHAFEQMETAAGQGTCGLEILEQLPEVDAILVPVGGGGLIAAIATAVKALSPSVQIVAVQPQPSPSLSESLRRGEPLLEYPAGPTLADGVAGGIGRIVWEHRHLIDAVVDVPEPELERAMVALLCDDQVVAEGSGALGVAALLAGLYTPPRGKPVAVVVSGGNVDGAVLERLLRDRA
jgi:threonine dehydratase